MSPLIVVPLSEQRGYLTGVDDPLVPVLHVTREGQALIDQLAPRGPVTEGYAPPSSLDRSPTPALTPHAPGSFGRTVDGITIHGLGLGPAGAGAGGKGAAGAGSGSEASPEKKPEPEAAPGGGGDNSPPPPPTVTAAPEDEPSSNAKTSEEILRPGGEVVGEHYYGAEGDITTVSDKTQFDRIAADLQNGSKAASTPRMEYDGVTYVRPDGQEFGIRQRKKYGETIDVFPSDLFPDGLKIHWTK
jgi:hypothetical protein